MLSIRHMVSNHVRGVLRGHLYDIQPKNEELRARIPKIIVSEHGKIFPFKLEVRKHTKEWMSISKFKPDLDLLASRVLKFNQAVKGLFDLILY